MAEPKDIDLCIVLSRPPYGDVEAAEALRHAMGAVGEELSTVLLLLSGGVMLAKKGQEAGQSGLTGLEETLRDCLDMGVEVLLEEASVKSWGLSRDELPQSARLVSTQEAAQVLKKAGKTFIF
jgi:sulfur relay (sulfurtransferase) DsrF/TusC family protein